MTTLRFLRSRAAALVIVAGLLLLPVGPALELQAQEPAGTQTGAQPVDDADDDGMDLGWLGLLGLAGLLGLRRRDRETYADTRTTRP